MPVWPSRRGGQISVVAHLVIPGTDRYIPDYRPAERIAAALIFRNLGEY